MVMEGGAVVFWKAGRGDESGTTRVEFSSPAVEVAGYQSDSANGVTLVLLADGRVGYFGDFSNIARNIPKGMVARARQGSAVHDAAGRGDCEALKGLVSSDVDARDFWGRTPLMLASSTNEVEAVRTLVKAGADVDAVCNEGGTPCGYAACTGSTDALRVLMEEG
eukprot:Hpha_TRINITY_DN15259_c1_g3::TRINITY_DN15259_c1_g3_i3::g.65804::m.65804